jgi:hypothetical protein
MYSAREQKPGIYGSEFQADNLLLYRRKIPHLEITKILRRYEEKQHAEEITN